jgi:CubicO group peptidase (beta-lactamase class C family)
MNLNRVISSTVLGVLVGLSQGVCAAESPQYGLTQSPPEDAGLLTAQLKYIDAAVNAAIQAKEIPGAVVLVARHGRCVFLKAFGLRSVEPSPESMTIDTIFDIASLTKVVATTPAIMLLVEQGSIRLNDRVKRYLPRFVGGGKDDITVRQLLTHYSGLPPDFDLSRKWRGYEAAMKELWDISTQAEPGTRFVYSDLNFITLGEIVHTVSGQTLDIFARENIFVPLGMSETAFNPPAEWRGRIAPTESRPRTLQYLKGHETGLSEEVLRGEVHDPTAWRMGGVAGHAGIFSTARDLALYGLTLLNKGSSQGRRFLSPLSIRAMTSPQSPTSSPDIRGLGWDIRTNLSSPRGDLFEGGFGHTGFTGASLWLDPGTDTLVVLLTNRVHPDGKGDVTHLRGVIANVVAAAISDTR